MSPGEGGARGFRPRFLRNRAFVGVPPRSGSGFERNEGAPSPTTKQQRQGNGKDNLGNGSKGTRRAVAVIRLAARRISRRRCALIVSGNSSPPPREERGERRIRKRKPDPQQGKHSEWTRRIPTSPPHPPDLPPSRPFPSAPRVCQAAREITHIVTVIVVHPRVPLVSHDVPSSYRLSRTLTAARLSDDVNTADRLRVP